MSISTYKFFVEKLGDRNIDTFIGDIGEIFYDPLGRNLRISDGVTPGGYTVVPTSSIGVAGNKKGMIAVDSSYLYACTADYNGTTDIWKRLALANTTW